MEADCEGDALHRANFFELRYPAPTMSDYEDLSYLYNIGRFEECIERGLRRLSDSSEDVNPHYYIALSALRLRDFALALEHCRSCTEKEPESPLTHHAWARYFVMQDRYTEGLAAADAAVALDPEEPVFHNVRGTALLGLDRSDEALASAKQALSVDPENESALYLVALILKSKGEREEALGYVNQGIRIYPESTLLHPLRAQLLVADSGLWRNYDAILDALRSDPDDEDLHAAIWAARGYETAMGFFIVWFRAGNTLGKIFVIGFAVLMALLLFNWWEWLATVDAALDESSRLDKLHNAIGIYFTSPLLSAPFQFTWWWRQNRKIPPREGPPRWLIWSGLLAIVATTAIACIVAPTGSIDNLLAAMVGLLIVETIFARLRSKRFRAIARRVEISDDLNFVPAPPVIDRSNIDANARVSDNGVNETDR